MKDTRKYIDVHCHLFSRDILSLVVRAVGSLKNQLKRLKGKNFSTLEHKRTSVKNLKDLLQRVKVLVDVIRNAKTAEDLYALINETYHQEYVLIPLMMDISYIVSDRNPDQTATRKNYWTQMKDDFNSDFHSALEHTRELIGDLIDKDEDMDWKQFIEEMRDQWNVIKEYMDKLPVKKRTLQPEYFSEQMEEMIRLSEAHPGMIYPFLAVDPARPGITDTVKEQVGKDKPFRGLKFYPPCGFSPSDPALYEIYAYCEKNGIPITTHCSYGGFCTFADEIYVNGHIFKNGRVRKAKNRLIQFEQPILNFPKAAKERNTLLDHPLVWAKVLKKFPRLVINFGHFGGTADFPNYVNQDTRKASWAYHILKLMRKYPNVYADISNYGDNGKRNTAHEFKNTVFDSKKISMQIKKRFLYGSDFYLMYLFQKDFDSFAGNYRDVFGEEFDLIAMDNPRRFLRHTCPE